jgi:REP element-mobilizing transposase RayT
MPNTYTQLYIHIIFAVAGRERLIPTRHKEQLYRYITGIVSHKNQKLLAVNGMPDHVHLLVSMTPDIALSELVRDVKANSSRFINEQHWISGRFAWQQGFGAFSYSASQVPTVAGYIEHQEQHHAGRSFREEYVELLDKFGVDYRPEFLFDFSAGE